MRRTLALLLLATACHEDNRKAQPAPEVTSPPSTTAPGAGCRGSVIAKDGNLYRCERDGSLTALTRGGKDDSTSLSPDGKRVAFLRKLGEETPEDGVAIADNRVMLLDLASRKTSEIGQNGVCVSLWAPKFAFDDVVLVESYGLSEAAARNRSVCAIDLATKKMSLLSRGTLCALPITAGRYRGNFFVPESSEGSAAVEKHWVVDKAGVVVRRFPNNPLAEVWSACDELRDPARAEALFKSL
jgi:hypothetical protein